MSQDCKFKNKWLPLAIALAFASFAHAQDKPKMTFTPAPPVGSAPVVSLAPPISAPIGQAASAPVQPVEKAAPVTEKSVAEKEPAVSKKPVVKHIVKKAPAKKPAIEKVVETPKDDVAYSPQSVNEVLVSDTDLNIFVFPSPIANGPILPAGVPLLGKPIYMANNTQVLLQFQKGYDKRIQMIVETEDGKVHKVYLKPRAIAGVTYRADGARDARPEVAKRQEMGTTNPGGQPGARAEDIELLKRVVRGEIPAEFESVALPKPTRFDKFTVVPLSGWTDNSTKKVMVFSLVAAPGQTAVVAPPQFYRQGINAVLLTGDHVSESTTPQLFVVEELNNE